MAFEHRTDTCFAGPLTRAAVDATLASGGRAAIDWVTQAYEQETLPLLRLPERSDDLDLVRPIAERLKAESDHVLVLGTGGSSLGGKTLVALADRGFGPQPGTPRLHFLDNVDPVTFADFYKATEGQRVSLVVISKSGSTAETLTQFLVTLPRLGDTPGARVVAITEPTDNPLRRIANSIGATLIEHDPLVGGRYSVLSVVGLLPAMIAGLDASAVRVGAARVLRSVLKAPDPAAVAPMLGAAIAVAGEAAGLTTTVLMPYVDRLAEFGQWYRQLWAESLGKQGKGTNPVRAMGTVDQHSQVQLYLGGPDDKLYTVLMAPSAGQGDPVKPGLVDDPRLSYLAGRSLGDLLDAEARATYETLVRNKRPTRLITLPAVGEEQLGELFMHYMLETILASRLMGVDAFDQPAVEEGKVLARQYLGEMARS